MFAVSEVASDHRSRAGESSLSLGRAMLMLSPAFWHSARTRNAFWLNHWGQEAVSRSKCVWCFIVRMLDAKGPCYMHGGLVSGSRPLQGGLVHEWARTLFRLFEQPFGAPGEPIVFVCRSSFSRRARFRHHVSRVGSSLPCTSRTCCGIPVQAPGW